MANGWGGKRANAGRKPKHPRTPVADSRAPKAHACPVEQTLQGLGYPAGQSLRAFASSLCKTMAKQEGLRPGSIEMDQRIEHFGRWLKANPDELKAALDRVSGAAAPVPAEASPVTDPCEIMNSDSPALKNLDWNQVEKI